MTKNIRCSAKAEALPDFIYSLIDILAYQAAKEDLRRQPMANDNHSDLIHFKHKDII